VVSTGDRLSHFSSNESTALFARHAVQSVSRAESEISGSLIARGSSSSPQRDDITFKNREIPMEWIRDIDRAIREL
jgi:hypothetical protein